MCRCASRTPTATAWARSWCATRHVQRLLPQRRATRADLREHDGVAWMHTGDAGILRDDGELVVVDRVRDLAHLANGDAFSPQFVENKLKFSPYVGECVALGHGREFVTALLCIRFSIVSKWAESSGWASPTYSDLSARPQVAALLRRGWRPSTPAARGAAGAALLPALGSTPTTASSPARGVRRNDHQRALRLPDRRCTRGASRWTWTPPSRWPTGAEPHRDAAGLSCRFQTTRRQPMKSGLLLQFALNGLIIGTLYGMVAMCFVLVFKARARSTSRRASSCWWAPGCAGAS